MENAPRVLAGRYEVGELIGRGGMAEVHIGHDTRLGRTVAIKILRSDLARDPSFLTRFRREAQSAAALNHPAIVAVYDTGEDIHTDTQGASVHVPFIVMEYVEGQTVRDIVRDGQSVPIEEAVEITAGVLAALEYSHHAGIVHRDIKPANVMITPTGAVKVMDFGIARAMADSAATMTQTQAVIGTAQYLSPEQARGETVDARSDLYSTGCLFYEMLTGRPPFVGDSPVAVAYQHVRETPLKPSDVAPDVPEVLDRITLKALAKDRTDRYSSAGEFRADLDAASRGTAISAGALGVVAAGAAAAGAAGAATQVMGAADSTQVMGATQENPWGATALQNPTSGTQPVPVDPDEEEPKSRKGLMWTLIAIGAVAIAAIVAFLLLGGEKEATEFEVPAISEGMTVDEARDLVEGVEGAEFTLDDRQRADDAEAGTFLEQTPEGGTMQEKGAEIVGYWSSGPDSVEVPDVVGQSQDDARAAIEAAGLKVGSTSTEDSSSVAADHVISTDPAGGDPVEAGATVNLTLSTGEFDVPDLTGMSEDEATSTLSDAGLNSSVRSEQSAQQEPGDVFRQDPSAGTSVTADTTVTIWIAEEPEVETTTVPDVTGLSQSDAEVKLRQEGNLNSTVTTEASDSVAAGQVIRTDPGSGSEVEVGTVVTIVVSTGPSGESDEPGNGNGNGDDGGPNTDPTTEPGADG
ncbi:Stk1 family PASTA domain-containing Ser/Thr kinase [Paraoerskovia marina]|uniref:Stk1 family PASTA domain-containing Ser/Thr kinase n=1 Tax=Paraoerskovia marina TaxID=545619 RepID=UPI0004929169|nr:Stk1 family PASTA domain-containing Ser/Thr kinase [Paraoerskovia marina]